MTAPNWTDDLHARAKQLIAEATPGPWTAIALNGDMEDEDPSWIGIASGDDRITDVVASDGMSGEQGKDDAMFIAFARTALPLALEEIERLRGEVKRLETEITDYALTRVTGRLGPTNAEIDAADNAAGRRRARRRK